ncbi:hypothetical protein PALU110988_04065 [Paenibacillus lupini]|uniref:hypothetical protein n=1 Tax=Paenibacillus lupini TaxID=1450204 RepID=UPI001ABBDE75|nr:hypothetical protein [Paenibacillus lupini]NIK25530.1 GMP synthase-like glutamine amidotransferase [Paenibacillus lupini]
MTIVNPADGLQEEWLDTMELLLILGGPMSVYEEEAYPWLIEEKRFVKAALNKRIKTIGICLGAPRKRYIYWIILCRRGLRRK